MLHPIALEAAQGQVRPRNTLAPLSPALSTARLCARPPEGTVQGLVQQASRDLGREVFGELPGRQVRRLRRVHPAGAAVATATSVAIAVATAKPTAFQAAGAGIDHLCARRQSRARGVPAAFSVPHPLQINVRRAAGG